MRSIDYGLNGQRGQEWLPPRFGCYIDMSQTPLTNRKDEFVRRLIPLLQEIKDMTAGTGAEHWLNAKYGVKSELYQDLARQISLGVKEGWAADGEVAGPRYRRSRLVAPCEETFFFSVTAVLMDSTDNTQHNPEGSFRGDPHLHPYGEFNLVVPLDTGAALAGPNGWCHGGWTTPAPGSQHFPEVKGGAVISLTFLPAGRIAFNVGLGPVQH
jgi:hypothetical protein